jgi:hypothetical protein
MHRASPSDQHIQPDPADSLEVADGGGVLRRPIVLDLDLMAAIAVEAGRDAVLGRGTQPPFASSPALLAIPTADGDDSHGTANRLYQACLQGATDPAAD